MFSTSKMFKNPKMVKFRMFITPKILKKSNFWSRFCWLKFKIISKNLNLKFLSKFSTCWNHKISTVFSMDSKSSSKIQILNTQYPKFTVHQNQRYSIQRKKSKYFTCPSQQPKDLDHPIMLCRLSDAYVVGCDDIFARELVLGIFTFLCNLD